MGPWRIWGSGGRKSTPEPRQPANSELSVTGPSVAQHGEGEYNRQSFDQLSESSERRDEHWLLGNSADKKELLNGELSD